MRESDFLVAIRNEPEDKANYLIYADWLDEHDRPADAESVRKYAGNEQEANEAAAPQSARGYDWREVFAYGGAERGYGGSSEPDRALPNDDTPTTPFARSDVKRIIAQSEGENDGANWLIVGELQDGRFFSISAWCDYTGWD
jgi:uncharacterized protein (TIGR02996 family)